MKNKINRVKKAAAVLLAVVILVSAVSFAASAAESGQRAGASNGTTGDCTWTFGDDGTLTISGNGYMRDYTPTEHPPWGRQDVKKVIIENGVLNVGDQAFNECEKMTDVTIPDSVKSIGSQAFGKCFGLTSVDVGKGVTIINRSAFSNCSNLTSVTLHSGLTRIESTVFFFCINLKNINIPDSVTYLGGYVFEDCWSLESITIPEGVTTLYNEVFAGCTSLETINIPDSVNYLYNGVFENTKWYNDLPDGIVYAGKVAYMYKGDLPANKSVIIKRGTTDVQVELRKITDLECVIIPDSVTWIQVGAIPEDPVKLYGFKGSLMETEYSSRFYKLTLIDHSEIGDVNLDGIVDVRDVTVIQRHVAEYELITGEPLAFTDTDNDGNVTVADATLLQRYLAEFVSEL